MWYAHKISGATAGSSWDVWLCRGLCKRWSVFDVLQTYLTLTWIYVISFIVFQCSLFFISFFAATEVQNIQIGEGDVMRDLPFPIHMVFPRLFTCPTLVTANFKVGEDPWKCGLSFIIFEMHYFWISILFHRIWGEHCGDLQWWSSHYWEFPHQTDSILI